MPKPAAAVSILALRGISEVEPGADLVELVSAALAASELSLEPGDVLVFAQKIVSKAEGRVVELREVTPSERADALAAQVDKDPRLVELVLREAAEVLRAKPGVLIVEHKLGFVLANAGIDQSNVRQGDEERVLLLPEDPDYSCRRLRKGLRERTGVDVAVLIIDSIGRAWRTGTVGTVIGVSGLQPLQDLRGQPDMLGRPLQTTEVGIGDEIAAAASMVMGQSDEGRPVVIVRGLDWQPSAEGASSDLLRPKKMDLFR